MQKTFLLIFLYFLSFSHAKTLQIDNKPIYNTKEYVEFSLRKNNQAKWTKDTKSFNTFKNAHLPYWAKINIKNISKKRKTYYFKAENQFTYQVIYCLYKKGKLVQEIKDGVISKNRKRAFNSNHMIFPLTLEENETATAYFKIKNYNKINLNFELVNEAYLLDYYQGYDFVEGIFFGGMLLMMLYNLFLYFLLKFKPYLYYVSYVFWLSVYFIGLFGFSQRYFEDYTWIFYISSGAFFISLILFVQGILGLKEKLPKIYNMLNLFILYFIIAMSINIYALESQNFMLAQILFNLFFFIIPLLIALIIGTTYYLAYYRNDEIANFYSIIWTAIALIGLLLPLEYLNIMTFNLPTDYIFQFLILFEVLSFAFILSYKIKLMEHEKEEQAQLLVQQNKLASMGEMISVIAHQWRQPLSEINGTVLNLDLDYRKNQLTQKKLNKYLDNVEETTAYMSHTINDFIDFFKPHKKIELLNLSDIINTALNLVDMSNNSLVKIDYIENKILLKSYKSELIQALLIVINNAIDACLANPNRESKITIKSHKRDRYIQIQVIDTGGGIAPEILEKIYDPYFTTKHKSKGTGLGLYILKMIIEQAIKGRIEISSSKSETICNILIPNNCDL